MLARIRNDVRTALENDPAADSWATVLLTYAGLHAVWGHLLAHAAWERGHRLSARLFSHVVRFATGVEIHPGAEIGERVFIDHGMGTVVGETAEIGDDVQMFHGVTLGGKSDDPEKRHPTLEDGVTVGASATLLGDITIGENATVGAGAVVVDDVAPGETVAGVPARPLESDGGAVPTDDVVTDSGTQSIAVDSSEIDPAETDRTDLEPEDVDPAKADPADAESADADGKPDGCCEAD